MPTLQQVSIGTDTLHAAPHGQHRPRHGCGATTASRTKHAAVRARARWGVQRIHRVHCRAAEWTSGVRRGKQGQAPSPRNAGACGVNRIIPLTLATALFMENMDATVIATSLPAIAQDIGTSPVALKLAFTAYFVALAIFVPLSAWLSDRFGTRLVLLGAIVVFMAGSVACALSESLTAFVFARFLKGMGGAMMAPLARLILVRTTDKSQLVNAMAWLTIPGLIAPTIGPPLGGFLTTYLSWHWIFLINIPFGVAGIALIWRFLPETPQGARHPLDWRGFLLAGVTFAGIVFGLSLLSLPILPLWVGVAATVLGVATGAGYVVHARRAPHPLLDLGVFRNGAFRATVIGTSFFLIGIGAIPFLLPLLLQVGLGYTPFEAGMIVFVGAFGALLLKFFARTIFAAIGFRTALLWTALLSAVATALHGLFTPGTPVAVMMVLIFVAGLIRSVYFTGQNVLAFAELNETDAGPAAAIHAVVRPIVTALGVAVAGAAVEASARLGGLSAGDAPGIADFRTGFFVVAALSLFAVVPYLFIARGAGSEASGHEAPGARAAQVDRSRQIEGRSPRF